MTPRELPILFSAPMIRALLAGTKTQTRRIIRPQPRACVGGWVARIDLMEDASWCVYCNACGWDQPMRCPYGVPGDRLWVRETWRALNRFNSYPVEPASLVAYEADANQGDRLPVPEGRMGKLRPSIFMPRWASRITLEIIDVRVQRLREISEDDARAEGIVVRENRDQFNPRGIIGLDGAAYAGAMEAFAVGWDTINGKRGPWASNPWVWALTFRRLA